MRSLRVSSPNSLRFACSRCRRGPWRRPIRDRQDYQIGWHPFAFHSRSSDFFISQIPDDVSYALEECTKRCNIARGNQPTYQYQKGNNSDWHDSNLNSSSSNNNNVKSNLDLSENGQNKGLIIGLIVAVGVMALGYIALAAFALSRRRKGGDGRGYVRTGETFAPRGVYEGEKYELPSEHLKTPYDPPSGSR